METAELARQEPRPLIDKDSSYFLVLSTCFQLLPLLFLVGRLIHIWAATPPTLTAQFDDDAFYYLKVAQNIVHHHQVSFDQVTTTNGFHPLWLGMLLPFTYFIDDRLQLLRFVAAFSTTLLAAAFYLVIRHLLRNYHLFTAAFVTCATLYWVKQHAYGHMELAILLPLCVICISKLPSLIAHPTRSLSVQVGVLFAMIFLARLDAAFLIACLCLVTLIAVYRHNETPKSDLLKLALRMAIPPFVVGTICLATNYVVFGHVVPVSGYVKSLKPPEAGILNLALFADLSRRPWFLFSGTTVCIVAYLVAVASAKSLRMSLVARNEGLFAVSIAIALFNVIFALYYLFYTSWIMWSWYTYPAFLSTVFVIPLVIEQLLVYVSHTARKGLVFSAFNVALAGMALLAIAYSGKDLVTSNRDRSASFKYENYLLAQEINRKFPDKPLIAMGDRTGSFAYWYNGNVLQMEGVIGNYELAEAIKRNDLAEYLTKYGVQALLHWCYEYDPYHPQYYGDSHNFFTKIWNPKMDFAPAENYAEWDLVTPWPFLSMGPYARLRLYKEDELLRFRHKNGLVYLWKWRGSEPRPKRNER